MGDLKTLKYQFFNKKLVLYTICAECNSMDK